MTENDNSTLRVDDIMRAAQDDPELARNLAAALAEFAPEQAVAALAEVAPKRAAAAAARAAPKRAAAAAAEVAPEEAAAALGEAAPDKARDIAAGVVYTLSSKDKKDSTVELAQTIPSDTLEAKEVAHEMVAFLPQVDKKSIANDALEDLSPGNKKDVVNEVLKALPAEVARSIGNTEFQKTMHESNRS